MSGGQSDLVYRVAKAIAAARRGRGLTQEGLAANLGIAVKNLQRIEAGKQNLSLATLERICTALGVGPETLLAPTPPDAAPTLPRVLARLAAAGYAVRPATERGRKPAHSVPVMTLRAAGGRLTGLARSVEVLGWVNLPRTATPPSDQFVAEVRGESMAPRIPDRSLCLFGPPAPPPLRDRIVLVAHDALADDELGGPYALKRVRTAKKLRNGRTRVVLESINPSYPPIVIEALGDELRVVAELVRVLAPTADSPRRSV